MKDRFDRIHKELTTIAKRWEGNVWLMNDDGTIEVVPLAELADKEGKDRISWKTIILPPSCGGLEGGMLDGTSLVANDVADTADRKRVWNDKALPSSMHIVRTIRFPEKNEDEEEDVWYWLRMNNEGERSANKPVLWQVHVDDVVDKTTEIVNRLPLTEDLKREIILAARYHDHGKKRKIFQRVLGNTNPAIVLAKSGQKGTKLKEIYRHEFGSLFDISAEISDVSNFVLHLIATHHGRARPHFPAEEVYDPDHKEQQWLKLACEVPRRFGLLQRKYGRWGLAYLESLLRAADWAASAKPSAYYTEDL